MTGTFFRGFIDGALSTLGIVIGGAAAAPPIIVAAAAGGTLANGFSNLLSALAAEGVEGYRHLRRTEESMVSRTMTGSEPARRVSRKTAVSGAIDGIATVIGGSIPIIPYLFLPVFEAMIAAAGTVVVAVALIGAYLGRLSRKGVVLSSLKMAVFCVLVAAAVYLVQSLIAPAR